MWRRHFGTVKVAGKEFLICWFHANRPGGCNQQEFCKFNHTMYPEFYKGSPFEKLSVADQEVVVYRCSKEV